MSLFKVGNGVFEVLSTFGDTHLGGDDFDKEPKSHVYFLIYFFEYGYEFGLAPFVDVIYYKCE